jgi:blue copper oxidase
MLTRRQFAAGTAAALSTSRIALPGPVGWSHFDGPLPIPKLIDVAKEGNAVSLKATTGRHEFIKGKPSITYGYSGPILGPVIRARRGDKIAITVQNALDRNTTVHWHGLSVPGEVDGGPHQIIKPGGTWRPVLKIDQPACTAWFHAHPHHDTARQVYLGLASMILILQDRSIEPDGSLVYRPSPLSIAYGSRGDTIIVNGAIAPVARVPRGLIRLRILDAANARNFYLRFGDGRAFHVIASDRGFLAAPVKVTTLRISPGERFEILVDVADGNAVTLMTGPDKELGLFGGPTGHAIENGDQPVMCIKPTDVPGAVRNVPTTLIKPAAADPDNAVRQRQFILDSSMCADPGPGPHPPLGRLMCINGKTHDLARIDEEVKLGTTEIWQVFSVGMVHPFHIHGAAFRVLSIAGTPPPAHLMGWKDTVLVEDKAELLVVFDHPASRHSPFMYHCHILEHEDAGMMGQYVCT